MKLPYRPLGGFLVVGAIAVGFYQAGTAGQVKTEEKVQTSQSGSGRASGSASANGSASGSAGGSASGFTVGQSSGSGVVVGGVVYQLTAGLAGSESIGKNHQEVQGFAKQLQASKRLVWMAEDRRNTSLVVVFTSKNFESATQEVSVLPIEKDRMNLRELHITMAGLPAVVEHGGVKTPTNPR